MTSNRAQLRNVFFYDGTKATDNALGGLMQNGSVTEKNFLDMLGILLVTEGPIRVQNRTSHHILSMSEDRLEPDIYDVYCNGAIDMSDEPWVQRIVSHNVTGRVDAFSEGIRKRDGKCVMSGVVNRMAPYTWVSFEVAHLFPVAAENLWIQWGYGRWVTDIEIDGPGDTRINSIQNGFLLRKHIHELFDQYLISVNPDDNYKIVVFDLNMDSLDGRILDPVCRNPEDPHRVSDEILRWHFRQSVLANMRGVCEPVFEQDFAGRDMIGDIAEGPCAKERFELEVATRLYGLS